MTCGMSILQCAMQVPKKAKTALQIFASTLNPRSKLTRLGLGSVFVTLSCTPPKRPRLGIGIDEKGYRDLGNRSIETVIYH
jgi:hypothetical protein